MPEAEDVRAPQWGYTPVGRNVGAHQRRWSHRVVGVLLGLVLVVVLGLVVRAEPIGEPRGELSAAPSAVLSDARADAGVRTLSDSRPPTIRDTPDC